MQSSVRSTLKEEKRLFLSGKDVFFLSEAARNYIAIVACCLQTVSLFSCILLLIDLYVFFYSHVVGYFLPMGYLYALAVYCCLGIIAHAYLCGYFMDQMTLGTRWTLPSWMKIVSISMLVHLGISVLALILAILFRVNALSSLLTKLDSAMQNYDGKINPKTHGRDKYHVDAIQSYWKCCGMHGFGDWLDQESFHLHRFARQITFNGEPLECGQKNLTNKYTGKVTKGDFGCYIPHSCCRIDSVDCTPIYTMLAPTDSPTENYKWISKTGDFFYSNSCPDRLRQRSHTWVPAFFCLALIIFQLVSLVLKRYLDTSIQNSFKTMKPLKTAPGWLRKYPDKEAERFISQAELKHRDEKDFDDFYNNYVNELMQQGIEISETGPLPGEESLSDPASRLKQELLGRMVEIHQGFWKGETQEAAKRYAELYQHSPDTGIAGFEDESYTDTSSVSLSSDEDSDEDVNSIAESLFLSSRKLVSAGTTKPVSSGTAKPVSGETTNPFAIETPKPVSIETPKPVSIETPKPVPIETPKPVSIETPKPVSVETPKPVSIETPKPVSVETTQPVSIETPKPVSIETTQPAADLSEQN